MEACCRLFVLKRGYKGLARHYVKLRAVFVDSADSSLKPNELKPRIIMAWRLGGIAWQANNSSRTHAHGSKSAWQTACTVRVLHCTALKLLSRVQYLGRLLA